MQSKMQRNAKGFPGHTKQNAKELLLILSKIQCKIEKGNSKDLEGNPKPKLRSRGRFASPGPEPDMR